MRHCSLGKNLRLGEQKHFDFIYGCQVELPDDLGQNLQIDAVGSGWKSLMAFALITAPYPILEFSNSSVFARQIWEEDRALMILDNLQSIEGYGNASVENRKPVWVPDGEQLAPCSHAGCATAYELLVSLRDLSPERRLSVVDPTPFCDIPFCELIPALGLTVPYSRKNPFEAGIGLRETIGASLKRHKAWD